MNPLSAFSLSWPFSPELVERLGWVLVHSLWQFALLAAVAGVISRLLRRSFAAARYAMFSATLALAVAAPVATWLAQPGDTLDRSPAVNTFTELRAPASFPTGELLSTNDTAPDSLNPYDAKSSATVKPQAEAPPIAAAWWARAAASLRPYLGWIVAIWGVGVALFSARPLLGWFMLRRLQRVGISAASEDVLAAVARVSKRLGLHGTIRVWQSTLAQVPVVVGYLRPVILLPVSLLTSLPAAQIEAILAHELAHVRRHDFVVNLLQTLVETLFFYHPAVWWLSRQIRVEREHCCDDLVVKLLGNRVEYGRALVAVEQLRSESPLLALGATDGSLLARIRRIVGVADPHAASLRNRWFTALLGVAIIALACGLAIHGRLSARDEETRSDQGAEKPDANKPVTDPMKETKPQDDDKLARYRELPDKDVEKFVLETLRTPYNPDPSRGSWQGGAHDEQVLLTLSLVRQQQRVLLALLNVVNRKEEGSLDERRLAMIYLGGAAPHQVLPILIHELEAALAAPPERGFPYHEIEVLGQIGEKARAAVPVLIKLLDSQLARGGAMDALTKIGPSSTEVMNALAEHLDDPRAVYRIYRYGELAKPLGPQLVKTLDSKSSECRTWAAQALVKSGYDKAKGYDVLLADLAAGTTENRSRSATALAALGSQAKEMIPKLREFENDRDEQVAKKVRDAIRRIEKDDRIYTHAEEAAKKAESYKSAAEAQKQLRAAEEGPADEAVEAPTDEAIAPPKGLEFLKPYKQLHGLSIEMTRKEFLALAERHKLKFSESGGTYRVPTGDGHTVLVMFRKGSDKCTGIQRLRGEDTPESALKAAAAMESPEAMTGEPTWITFKVTNPTDRKLLLVLEGDYRNRFTNPISKTVPESFSVETRDERGTAVPQPAAEPARNGVVRPSFNLPANGEATFALFLPHWATITQPGSYRITIRCRCELFPDAGPESYQEKPDALDLTAETMLQVVAADAEKFGKLIDRLGPQLLSDKSEEAERVHRMLVIIRDERAVAWYVKLLEKPTSWQKYYACDGLAPYGSEAAFSALKRAMTTTADDITNGSTRKDAQSAADGVRHAAAVALAKNPHAAAAAFLLTQAADRYDGVRLTVLHLAARLKTKRARDVIERLTKDADKGVRNEAVRVQQELQEKPEARAELNAKDPLAQKVSLTAKALTLKEALAALARSAGLELQLNAEALKQVELDVNEPVTITIKDEPLVDALGMLIDWEAHLGAFRELRGRKLIITTLAERQEFIARHLPDWLQPVYNQGLLATLDDDNQIVSITAGEAIDDELMGRIKTLPKLRELNIETTKRLSPKGLDVLSAMASLEKLSFYSMQYDGEWLGDAITEQIVGLKALRELSLGNCGVTDEGVRQLEVMPQLTLLSLNNEGRLTDAALTSIGKLKNLKSLSLSSYVATVGLGRMKFSADGIRRLVGLQQLEELHLVGQAVSAEALVFPRLKSLSLGLDEIDDTCAERIATLRDLTSLELVYTKITDAGLKKIAELPALARLNLDSHVVTDAGIGHLKKLPNLQHISLRVTQLTDASLTHLAEMKGLQRIDLNGSGQPGSIEAGECFSMRGVIELKALPKLRTLWLTNVAAGGGYSGLKDLTHLRELTLTMTDIRLDEFKELEEALPNTRIHHVTGGGFSTEPKKKRLAKPAAPRPAKAEAPAQPPNIRLTGDEVTPEAITKLSDRNWGTITLADARFNGEIIERLRRVPSIHTLRLFGEGLSGQIPRLETVKGLVGLEIGTPLKGRDLEAIAQLSNLESLTLPQEMTINVSGAREIAKLVKLTSLKLYLVNIDDAAFVELRTLVRLDELDLSHTRITDAGLATVVQMPLLPNLDWSFSS